MTERQKTLPKWILIVSGLIALLEIAVSVSLYFSPESVVESIDLNASGVDYVVKMWAARQLALGVIFAYATFKKSAPMLSIAYIFFLVMFIGDFFIGVSERQNPLIISAIVMCVISSVLIYKINRESE